MSDVQWLFTVLAALYGWECLCWLRRGGIVYRTWLGHHWELRQPGALAGNQSGGFVLASPLPPLGTIFVTNQSPLSLAPEGVLAFVATNVNPGWRPTQAGRFVAWNEMRTVEARGKRILVNEERLLDVATPALARHFAAALKQLGALPPQDRADAIKDFVASSFDSKKLEARRSEWQPCSRALRWLTNMLVVYVFGVCPASIWYFGLGLSWLGLLLGLLTFTVVIGIRFNRAHRRLYPDAPDERFTHTLTIALAPTSAMRALDALSRPLLETFHPLAAARALLDDANFRRFARRVLLDTRHPALPRSPGASPSAPAVEQFFRQVLLAAVESFLARQGMQLDELGRAPQPGEASSRAYCPRCEAQFTSVEHRCGDCGGLELVAFVPPQGPG